MKYLFAVLLFIATAAIAGTDYSCMSDCQSKGYSYGYCTKDCSYRAPVQWPEREPTPKVERTDYSCLSDCQGKGYQYSYCKSKCSY